MNSKTYTLPNGKKAVFEYDVCGIGKITLECMDELMAMIADRPQDAPSIDIVRCKECKWGKPYSDKQLECDALGLGGLKFPDDFCSYGVRKTNTTAEKSRHQ